MTERIQQLLSMFPASTLFAIAIASAAVFVGTLIAIPFILVRLPADYFDIRVRRTWMKDQHPLLRWTGLLLKNILGLAFLAAGIAMLILPGQGVLTILIGISMLDFPGKRKAEARLIGIPTVLNAVNSLRAKFGKPPLVIYKPLD